MANDFGPWRWMDGAPLPPGNVVVGEGAVLLSFPAREVPYWELPVGSSSCGMGFHGSRPIAEPEVRSAILGRRRPRGRGGSG